MEHETEHTPLFRGHAQNEQRLVPLSHMTFWHQQGKFYILSYIFALHIFPKLRLKAYWLLYER